MVSYMELMTFMKGEDEVMVEARNILKAHMLETVFEVSDASEIDVDEILAQFRKYDENGDGKISSDEFAAAMVGLGYTAGSDELELALRLFDANDDGFISPAEFIHFVKGEHGAAGGALDDARQMLQRYVQTHVLKGRDDAAVLAVFKGFDASGDGTLAPDEFTAALVKLGFDRGSE